MGVRVRFSLPDRPGALAMVTKAIATTGADVLAIRVIDRDQGRAVDEMRLRWPVGSSLDPIVAALAACPGVTVEGHRRSPWLLDGRPDLDLLGHLLTTPERGIETVIDMLPAVLDADWAVLRARGDATDAPPLYATQAGSVCVTPPGELPPRAQRFAVDGTEHVAIPMPPIGCLAIAGRASGPSFTRAELMEADRVVGLALATLQRIIGAVGISPTALTGQLLRPVGRVPLASTR